MQTRNMALELIEHHGPATLTCHLDTLAIEYHGPVTLTCHLDPLPIEYHGPVTLTLSPGHSGPPLRPQDFLR